METLGQHIARVIGDTPEKQMEFARIRLMVEDLTLTQVFRLTTKRSRYDFLYLVDSKTNSPRLAVARKALNSTEKASWKWYRGMDFVNGQILITDAWHIGNVVGTERRERRDNPTFPTSIRPPVPKAPESPKPQKEEGNWDD